MKIGIDLGGTKTEGILLNPHGEELIRKRIKTEKNYSGTIKGIKSIVENFENQFGTTDSVGIGMPGAVSSHSALIKNANSIWLNGKPLKKDLEESLNRKVNLENDANCFALSEAVDGAGKNKQTVFGVIIGTGVGGGVIINKKILQGRNNIGGEWGHIALPNRSKDEIKYNKHCYCAHKGCMETYVSGPGFANCYNAKHNTNLNSHEILKDLPHNERSQNALSNYIDQLARGLSVVVNILDPDTIVLGGGMSNVDSIYETINDKLTEYVFSDVCYTRVVKNIHGDSGGVRGAAWLS
jgi:fructokinase